jgi:FkbM family methyltransferase
MDRMYQGLYKLMLAAGKPVGGPRPRRLLNWLGRLAHKNADFDWFKNRWGANLFLSPRYHIDRDILAFGCYDTELHLAIERVVQPGMVCMDIGAHFGEVALHMAARAGKNGRVYAFEPEPQTYERLIKHAERNERRMPIVTSPLALSDRTGPSVLYAMDGDADNQGLGSLLNSRPQLTQQIEVQSSTLDAFVKAQKLERLDVIKIDIQGAEIRCLRGAHETLRRFNPILFLEISPADLKSGGWDSRDLCEVLEVYGYAIYRLKKGVAGKPINPRTVKKDFCASNVFCTKKIGGGDVL